MTGYPLKLRRRGVSRPIQVSGCEIEEAAAAENGKTVHRE
jgi:hypothetical protein